MNRLLNTVFTTSFSLAVLHVSAQPAGMPGQRPDVPESVEFANLTVHFDEAARAIVRQDVAALMRNQTYWTAKLDRAALHFPVIEATLRSEGAPPDFKYLAVQESSLTPDAVSTSTAVGYWQFKRETALDHGLRVDEEVDERKNLTAATRAAARYMKRANGQYHNWVSALFSYYLGIGGISKLVPADWNGAEEITLTGRTDRYVLRFFAHKIAIGSALATYQSANPLALVEYPHGGGKTLHQIADELGADELTLRRYNRWLLSEGIPTDKTYVMAVLVPYDRLPDLRQRIATAGRFAATSDDGVVASTRSPKVFTGNRAAGAVALENNQPSPRRAGDVFVQLNGLQGIQARPGENADALARKGRIRLSQFLDYNDIDERDAIVSGDVYYLEEKKSVADQPYHVAQPGETSWKVAQRYALKLKRLLNFNRLDRGEPLAVGQVLWLQQRRPAGPPEIQSPEQRSPSPNRSADAVVAQAPTTAESTTSSERSGADNNIPRNASERKLYQPKLVEPAPTTTPERSTSAPDATYQQPAEPRQAEPVASAPTYQRPAERTRPTQDNGTERTIIIRGDGEPTQRSTTSGTDRPDVAERAKRQKQELIVVPEPPKSRPVERSKPAEQTERPTERPTRRATEQTAERSSANTLLHEVQPGQTYYSIAKRYGITMTALLEANGLILGDKLNAGQKLIIPGAAVSTTPPASVAASKSKAPKTDSALSTASKSEAPAKLVPHVEIPAGASLTTHVVQKGETLFRIAKQYGVTMEQILGWNKTEDPAVKTGQKLKIYRSPDATNQ